MDQEESDLERPMDSWEEQPVSAADRQERMSSKGLLFFSLSMRAIWGWEEVTVIAWSAASRVLTKA